MAKFSVKKPLTVFVVVLAIVVLGVVAYLRMTPDLLPNMDFPYVVIVTTDPGASPESVEETITRPMEQSMATLDRIKTVTSTTQNSVSMVMLEFEDGVNMDTISVDIQQKISILQGQWSDSVGAPYVLKINPSMIPVMVAAVSQEGKDVYALSDFVTDELTGKLEGVSGVAGVTVRADPRGPRDTGSGEDGRPVRHTGGRGEGPAEEGGGQAPRRGEEGDGRTAGAGGRQARRC